MSLRIIRDRDAVNKGQFPCVSNVQKYQHVVGEEAEVMKERQETRDRRARITTPTASQNTIYATLHCDTIVFNFGAFCYIANMGRVRILDHIEIITADFHYTGYPQPKEGSRIDLPYVLFPLLPTCVERRPLEPPKGFFAA